MIHPSSSPFAILSGHLFARLSVDLSCRGNISAKAGDVVFLIAWLKNGNGLVGLFTIGALHEHLAAPAIIPDHTFSLPNLPIPEHLLSELSPIHVEIDGHWLHPIGSDTCRSRKPRRPTGSTPKGLVSDALRSEGERVQAANSV
jgi:hypothetical protein